MMQYLEGVRMEDNTANSLRQRCHVHLTPLMALYRANNTKRGSIHAKFKANRREIQTHSDTHVEKMSVKR
jgi:hypothetical protein